MLCPILGLGLYFVLIDVTRSEDNDVIFQGAQQNSRFAKELFFFEGDECKLVRRGEVGITPGRYGIRILFGKERRLMQPVEKHERPNDVQHI